MGRKGTLLMGKKQPVSIESMIAIVTLCVTLFLATEITVHAFVAIVPFPDLLCVCTNCDLRVSIVPLLCFAAFAAAIFVIVSRDESASSKGTLVKIVLGVIATLVLFALFGLVSFSLIKCLAMIVLAALGVLTIALYGAKFFESKKKGATQNEKGFHDEYLELAVALFGVTALVLTVDSLVGGSLGA